MNTLFGRISLSVVSVMGMFFQQTQSNLCSFEGYRLLGWI